MDLINDGILWNFIYEKLSGGYKSQFTGVEMWSDGSEILVNNENAAEYIADFLEALGYEAHTGYYDPKQDERDGCVDEHTGYYYINFY